MHFARKIFLASDLFSISMIIYRAFSVSLDGSSATRYSKRIQSMSLSQLSVYSVVLYNQIRTLFGKRVLSGSHTIFHDEYHEVFRAVDHDIFLWDELKVTY